MDDTNYKCNKIEFTRLFEIENHNVMVVINFNEDGNDDFN